MLVAEKLSPLSDSPTVQDSPLERLLKRIRHTDDFPSISKYIFEINRKLSANLESSNASDLANVILNDYSLTNKLLKLVNSAFYGLSAGNVTTVTRAVVVLGYENVRLATLSLVLFDKFSQKSNAKDLREEVVGSFWSGVLSREIAQFDTDIDPEEAFVCALMCRLGKLAMIHYLPVEFRRIEREMAENGGREAKAVKSVCGVTYAELGMALARQWNFPPQICDAMQPLSDDDLEDEGQPPSKICALTSFVQELRATIQEKGLSESNSVFRNLLRRYRGFISISKRQLKTMVTDSIESVQHQSRALNVEMGNSLFLKQLSTIKHSGQRGPDASQTPLPSRETSMQEAQVDGRAASEAAANGSDTQGAEDILAAGIREISDFMKTVHDVNDIALMSLEVLYRAMGCHRALMFIRNGGSSVMNVRFGYGDNTQCLTHSVRWPVDNGNDLFNYSIQMGKDLIIDDAGEAKISNLIPNWYRAQINAPAFILLPVITRGVCIGALYADWKENGQPISTTVHHQLSMLRDQLVLAITHSQ